MIAVDTNVLLRYLLDDDRAQSPKAKTLIISSPPVLITDVVLVEAVWTLIGARYSLDRSTICAILRSLIGDGGFVFEDVQVVWQSLRDYETSKPVNDKSLDFPDALIANKAHYLAATKGGELSGFYSFDKTANRV